MNSSSGHSHCGRICPEVCRVNRHESHAPPLEQIYSIIEYKKRRSSTPGSQGLNEAFQSVAIISNKELTSHHHSLLRAQVQETEFGGAPVTRPQSRHDVQVNGPVAFEGLSHIDCLGSDGEFAESVVYLPSTSRPVQSNGGDHVRGPGASSFLNVPRGTGKSCEMTQQSSEDIRSCCGSRLSLLESTSRRNSRVIYLPTTTQTQIDHQYTNVGCTVANETQPFSEVSCSSKATMASDKKSRHLNQRSGAGHNHHQYSSTMSGNKSEVEMRKERDAIKKDLQRKMDLRWDKDTHDKSRCNWSFVFDPAGRLCYYWSMIVSMAFLYNFWVIIFRFSFAEITWDTLVIWFSLDYFMDVIYLLDILFHLRTGYLEDGVLQVDSTKLRLHYMNSTTFYVDCLCLLPLDFLYLSLGFKSILRIFRLVKVYQFWTFMDRSERHTNYPNVLRFVSLIHYLLLVFHWNACLFHLMHTNGFGKKESPWAPSEYPVPGDSVKTYLMSLYWTILVMTTIGDMPQPNTRTEYLYVIFELIFGLITFATVLGIIANIVTNVSAARKDFQAKLDGVKTYMRMRRVPNSLQNKVIKWFDYLWLTQKSSDEEKAVSCLPDKLKGEIAIHVHLDTLKRVEIFQNTEAGFLCELVLRLRPVLFSPGDYICRKGEVGKEMYICARGRLEVVMDGGKTVLATLKAGSYFGEISILNMGAAGNRRTASVRSVGYSDLFVLSKKDMWEVLKDYPAARVRLEAIAAKRLEKYKKAPLLKAALPRSTSTPGLVESAGKVPLENMWVSPLSMSIKTNNSPESSSQETRRRNESPNSDLMSTRSESTTEKDPALGAASGPHQNANCSNLMSNDSPSKTNFHHHHFPMSSSNSIKSKAFRSGLASTSGFQAKLHHHNSQASHQPSPLSIRAQSQNQGSPAEIRVLAKQADLERPQEEPRHDDLVHEIMRLRERIRGLESDNAAMHLKLSKTQKDVNQRLTEIELQIGPDDDDTSLSLVADFGLQNNEDLLQSGNSAEEDEENNRESFI